VLAFYIFKKLKNSCIL